MLSTVYMQSTAVAQPPDPVSVVVPNLQGASNPEVQRQGWKHFFFYKDGVSYTQAYSDLADCYQFLGGSSPVGPQSLPQFGARSRLSSNGPAAQSSTSNYGLVGVGIEQLVMGPMQRRLPQSRLRRCMEPRGYVRYAIDESTWKLLVDGYSQRSIAIQAKVASGPRPAAKVLTQ